MSVEPWMDAWPRSAMIPAARASDVAEQQLEQRGAADDLRAVRVLGPGHRVGERGRLVGAGGVQQRLGDLQEGLLRTAGDALDQLGRVTREVALDDLEDAARVLERVVAERRRFEQRLHQRLERRAGRQRRLLRRGCPRLSAGPPSAGSPTFSSAALCSPELLRGAFQPAPASPPGPAYCHVLLSYWPRKALSGQLLDLFLVLLQPGEHTVEVSVSL